jgi:hypothetical protein
VHVTGEVNSQNPVDSQLPRDDFIVPNDPALSLASPKMVLSQLFKESDEPFIRGALDPVMPALGVGAFTGASGLAVGLVSGSLRSAHPALFAAVSGAQWFGLGTTFWYTRSIIGTAAFGGQPKRNQELVCSTAAGGFAGGINGALRSRSNIIPGAIVLGLMGFAGQYGYNIFSTRAASDSEKGSMLQRFAAMKWVPLKSLSNEEYEGMLNEKLLSTEAEIAIIYEKIADLRSSQRSGHEKQVPRPD